jgi:RNA polymerase sigma-70 factor (ECF subfamily)
MMQAERLRLLDGAPPGQPDTPLAQRGDDDLMLLSRAGGERSFEELVRRHQSRVLRVALRYLGDPGLAADAAQATFIAILTSPSLYRARGTFKAYLYRVLINQCHMMRRSERTRARALESIAATMAAGRNVDESTVLSRERQRDIELALRELSPKLRDVVVLRFAADLDHAEIAQALSIPLGTAKRRLFVGLAKLRELLEER